MQSTSLTQLPSLREFMEKRPSHLLVELKPQMKNLDLKVVVLTKDQPKELKNKEVLYQCLVADQTGMINCNFYGDAGQAIKTGEEDPKIEDIEDERDKLIDLRGTRVSYIISSSGVALSMLAFVLGQPPLVMFSLLIFFGLIAQVIGDISRLVLYRKGF